MDGKLARRGWDIAQVAILTAMAVAGVRGRSWPRRTRLPLRVAAAAVAAPGAWLLIAGGTGLGEQLRTEPEPVEDGTLKRSGAFGLVRHPMYGGVLLLTLAWGLASSPAVFVPWSAGAAFLGVKVRREEELLRQQFPDYEHYEQDVPKRLIPFVF